MTKNYMKPKLEKKLNKDYLIVHSTMGEITLYPYDTNNTKNTYRA